MSSAPHARARRGSVGEDAAVLLDDALSALREKDAENEVLSSALAATRKMLAANETETAKLRELTRAATNGGDDEKVKLIAALFNKLDQMATRYSSVMETPTVAVPSTPEATKPDEVIALHRELRELKGQFDAMSAGESGGVPSGDVDKLKKQLRAAQDAKIAALADAEAFRAERDDANDEIERLRRGSRGNDDSSRVRELESLLAEAQNAMSLLSDDNEALIVKLRRYEEGKLGAEMAQRAARNAADAANEVATEAERAIFEAYNRSSGDESLVQELETQRELATRRADEVEKLKSIIRDMDEQREALSQKLRVAYASLREIESKKDSSNIFEGTSADKIISLENECMRLQDEADAAAEALEEARGRAMREGASAEEARRLGAAAEAKVYGAAQARDSAIARARSLEEQLERAAEKERVIANEAAQYREELAVISDDLMVMTKEQQILNAELLRAKSERDEALVELSKAKAAQSAAEAEAKAKKKEVDDVAKAYHELGFENRRVVADMDDMERDLRRVKAALESSDALLEQATERAKTAEAECKAYSTDLQAYQRQVDNLTHILENSARDKGEDMEALATKLEASRAMLFDMERSKEMARRETAAAEANLMVVRSRLTDAQSDTETLKHKLRLESNRVKELESLVSALRTHEHQAVVASGDSSQRSELLRERVSALQEQNHGLMRQVEALKEDRKSFVTEVERLRGVIENAASSGTPSKTSTSQTAALVRAEEAANEQGREVERLSMSLKELQHRCGTLEAALLETETAASNSKREALIHARREAEARAELDGVRRELAISRDALSEAMEGDATNLETRALKVRAQDAERRAAAAEASLASMQRENPVSQTFAEESRVLREENERLLHLLSKANDDLASARKIIDEQGYAEGATALLVDERVRTAEEARRRVEHDFEQLARHMQQMESGTGGNANRMQELEVMNAELEFENSQLRESLAGTEEAIAVMQRDLARTVEEYAALGNSLIEDDDEDSL